MDLELTKTEAQERGLPARCPFPFYEEIAWYGPVSVEAADGGAMSSGSAVESVLASN